jgi:hypothetical protein
VSQASIDVPYEQDRNRLTVAFRIILAIPHLIIAGAWQYAVQLAAIVQWFICLFTGKRNRGIWNFSNMWLDYYSRTNAYLGLLFDEYPGFVRDEGKTPLRYESSFDEPADRLTTGLRIIWAIPALLILMVLAIAAAVVTLVCWFAIVITGRMPQGMFAFLLKVTRYIAQTNAYTLLMTDTYPKYN